MTTLLWILGCVALLIAIIASAQAWAQRGIYHPLAQSQPIRKKGRKALGQEETNVEEFDRVVYGNDQQICKWDKPGAHRWGALGTTETTSKGKAND